MDADSTVVCSRDDLKRPQNRGLRGVSLRLHDRGSLRDNVDCFDPASEQTSAGRHAARNANALLKLLSGTTGDDMLSDDAVAHDGLVARLFMNTDSRSASASAIAEISFRLRVAARSREAELLRHVIALERLSALVELLHPACLLLPSRRQDEAQPGASQPRASETGGLGSEGEQLVVRNSMARLAYRPLLPHDESVELRLDELRLQLKLSEKHLAASGALVLPAIDEPPLPVRVCAPGSGIASARAIWAHHELGLILTGSGAVAPCSAAAQAVEPQPVGEHLGVELPLRLLNHPINAAMHLERYEHGREALRHGLAFVEASTPHLAAPHVVTWQRVGTRLALVF